MDEKTNNIFVKTDKIFPDIRFQDPGYSHLNFYYSIHIKVGTKYGYPIYVPLRIRIIE